MKGKKKRSWEGKMDRSLQEGIMRGFPLDDSLLYYHSTTLSYS